MRNRQSTTNRKFSQARKKQPTENPVLILFNKPFNTLCQFSGESGESTLAHFVKVKNVYPAGRLDKDSEGLLLLTNDGSLQHKISHPKHKMAKTYWAQVEGKITSEALQKLTDGVVLKDGKTKPATANIIEIEKRSLKLWGREPPVRFRQNIPTSWISLTIKEGKNRQVRRMTAAVGFPTLRLIRISVGRWRVSGLEPGEYRIIEL